MAKTTATVRMYRLHELGDCFLLKFTSARKSSHMLIDCGSFRNGKASVDRLRAITASIKKELGRKALDVVVATHQHNDHVSGFVHAKENIAAMKPTQVWLSWLDDPNDRLATGIGREHDNLRSKLTLVQQQLHGRIKGRTMEVLEDVLGFYGVMNAGPPQLPADGIRVLKDLAPQSTHYLKPGTSLDLPGLPAGSVKVHVLGPPRDKDLLYRSNPRKGESYDHALAAANLSANKLLDASKRLNGDTSREEEHYPFAERYKKQPHEPEASTELKALKDQYDDRATAWRTIDDDWLQQAEALALYLDTYTNNSSLVFAIELVESGKVLLFVGDAQTGNWLSWDSVKWEDRSVRTDDLLQRTVLYKVGHHGSHNATLKAALEKMESPDLVALVPVHKDDPNIAKPRGWKMPAAKLYQRIIQRTEGRMLRMDDHRQAGTDVDIDAVKAKWRAAKAVPRVTNEYMEIKL
jgi:beta-lactamase superfamily II metal-dependent hydrolase